MTTPWKDVEANPDYQKLDPKEKEVARNDYFNEVVAPKVSKEELTAVRQEFDRATLKSATHEQRSVMGKIGHVVGQEVGNTVAPAEAAAHFATGVLSLPVQAGASVEKLITAPWGLKAKSAAQASQSVGEAMTYQPHTEAGKGLTQVASKVLGIPGELGEAAEGAVQNKLENKGIPKTAMAAEITARMLPEIAATVLGARTGEAMSTRAAARSAPAVTAAAKAAANLKLAQDFVTSKTGMKWEDVPGGLQKKLQTAARDPEGLAKLDPETVQREARAERLGMPITRGDATRNLGQQSREDVVKKSGDENPIRDIRTAQDSALHGAVDKVRESTGAKAKTAEQVGQSVQDEGIRAKAKASKKAYDTAFDKARKTEPNATVPADPLYEALSKDPDIQHLGFVETWLRKAKIEQKGDGPGAPVQLSTDIGKAIKARDKGAKVGGDEEIERRPITLNELQDLREKAAGIARSAQGSDKYFASKLVKAIDKSFDKIPPAAKAWKEARSLYKAHQEEFEETGVIKALGANKRKSSDRRVDLEKTVTKVMNSSKEDIGKLKTTLTRGGTDSTRAAGTRAWRNVQAGVLDELKEAARGKRKIPGEKGQAQFQSTFLDMFNKLEANGKIDAIFDKEQAAQLREIAKGVKDVRTKSNVGISGSDTATNIAAQNTLSKLEKLSLVPYVGKTIAGAAKIGQGILKAGQTERELAHAKTTPVTEAAQKARATRRATEKKARRSKNRLETIRRGAPVAPALTLQNQSDQNRQ